MQSLYDKFRNKTRKHAWFSMFLFSFYIAYINNKSGTPINVVCVNKIKQKSLFSQLDDRESVPKFTSPPKTHI